MATKVHDALGEVAKTGKFVRTDSQFREIISKNHEEVKKPLKCTWPTITDLHLSNLHQ